MSDVKQTVGNLAVKLVEVNALAPYARNSRKHPPEHIQQIAQSITEFGWTQPILVDGQNGIIAGHGRYAAALHLGLKAVPVIELTGLTEAQKRALVIADNKLTDNSTFDIDMLRVELEELQSDGFDLSLTFFSAEELADILIVQPPEKEEDPDACPPVEEIPHSVPGDVWVLGPHRVMCGDSINPDDWVELMQGENCDCVWTDPPYNVAYGKKNEDLAKAGKGNTKAGSIKNDDMSEPEFTDFLASAFGCLSAVMKPGAAIYIAYPDRVSLPFYTAFSRCNFKLSGTLVWKKNNLVLGRTDYQNMHEPIIYGWKPGSAHRWYGGRKQVTVQEVGEGGPFQKLPDGRFAIRMGDSVMYVSGEATIEESPTSLIYADKPLRSDAHPTMKPVALVEKMLKSSARPGDIVVDAFGGSGTTLVAADRMGMSARLMEIEPRFVDVVIRRWQNYTGRQAVNLKTGAFFPFDSVATD